MQNGKRAAVMMVLALGMILNLAGTVKGSPGPPRVQLALLLDTSNSMDGLIDQAKNQLWIIVNEMARSGWDGRYVQMEVALYEYGKNGLPAGEGFMRQVSPLTTDLDRISEELFHLNTNGGYEFCGRVISSAVDELRWSGSNRDLKIIFIAGNEPFTQGDVDYREACRRAVARGVIVNTIFCGPYQQGIGIGWKDGADLSDGRYMNIDHQQQIAHIHAPQDDELARLGEELNRTYLGYGVHGEKYKYRQKKQDAGAMSLSREVMAQRAVTKASRHYRNSGWDLVDAVEEGKVAVEELEEDELPVKMRPMSPPARKEYVEKMKRERKRIQNRINKLNEERRKYIAGRKKNSPDDTLDAVVLKAIREQARDKNFSFRD
jgi:hypothetical protein